MNNGNINGFRNWNFIYVSYLSHAVKKLAAHYCRNRAFKPWSTYADINDGRLKKGAAPLLGENAPSYTDPIPQALILTAIVISFGVTAFFLVLAYRAYQELGTDNMDRMRGTEGND